MATIWDI